MHGTSRSQAEEGPEDLQQEACWAEFAGTRMDKRLEIHIPIESDRGGVHGVGLG